MHMFVNYDTNLNVFLQNGEVMAMHLVGGVRPIPTYGVTG